MYFAEEEVVQVALRRLSNLVPTNLILPLRPTFAAKRPPSPAGERLFGENNRLAEEVGGVAEELRGVAGEQSKLCTRLAADLLVMVWALTGAHRPVRGELDALQLVALRRLAG